jgi:hypothetical protein
LDERTWRDLARLADGTLEGPSRTELESRVEASPPLAAALSRQQVAVSALRGLEVAAPAGLRERIAATAQAPKPSRFRLRVPRLALGGGLAVAACAVLVALVVLPSGGGDPSVAQAAELSRLPATTATVPVDPANPNLLVENSEGVPFPNLKDEFGWREDGSRGDELEDRQTKTVFYERDGKRIGYTIISGEAVEWPEGAPRTTVNEVDLATTASADGQQIVTWRRGGHTCVLSGEGVGSEELLALAAWKGEGTIPF